MHPAPVTAHDWYLLACVAGTVLLLLLIVGKFKLHAARGFPSPLSRLEWQQECRSIRFPSRSRAASGT